MSLMLLLRGPCIRIGSLANPSWSMIVLKVCFKWLSSFGEGSRLSFRLGWVSMLLKCRLAVLFSL